MPTQITTMLAVSDPAAAIEFYRRAFGAERLWQIDDPAGVAGMSIDGARFFLADENPPSTRSPERVGCTTIRIELFVDDPHAVYERAVAAGAQPRNPVTEHTYATIGTQSTLRMLQGSVVDPFGHIWLIGNFLE
jgi:PhnB protein